MAEINWVQACIEAPLAVCLAVLLFKCYRARLRISFDSPCSKCCGLKFKMEMPGTLSERNLSDDSMAENSQESRQRPRTRSQTANAHGEGSKDIVGERARSETLTQGDFASAEASLEE